MTNDFMINKRVVNSFVVDKLIDEMKGLILFYEEKFDYNKIRSSKIQKWIDELDNTNIETSKKFKYYFQLRQYVRAMQIFKDHSDKIKKETITKMLSGGNDSKNDRSSDYFFEIDMARRFIEREDFENINLNHNTDIIFKSSQFKGDIFIECKNINSENSFESNLRKANNQLKTQLEQNESSLGIIAVNLTNVFDEKEYLDLLSPIMKNFINSYEGFGYNSSEILSDRNFEQTFSSLLQGLLELKFRKMFLKFGGNNYKFHKNIAGIFYQVELMVPIPNTDTFFVVRVATYFPFFSTEIVNVLLFHQLAIGV